MKSLWKEFLELTHPLAILYAIVLIPAVAIITIVVCALEIVGMALCAPSVAWKEFYLHRTGQKKTPPAGTTAGGDELD